MAAESSNDFISLAWEIFFFFMNIAYFKNALIRSGVTMMVPIMANMIEV